MPTDYTDPTRRTYNEPRTTNVHYNNSAPERSSSTGVITGVVVAVLAIVAVLFFVGAADDGVEPAAINVDATPEAGVTVESTPAPADDTAAAPAGGDAAATGSTGGDAAPAAGGAEAEATTAN